MILALVIAFPCVFSAWIVLITTEPRVPGTMGRIDVVPEIGIHAFVLNVLIPLGIAVIAAKFWMRAKIPERPASNLVFEIVAFASAVFVAITVWQYLARAHGPASEFRAERIWWHL